MENRENRTPNAEAVTEGMASTRNIWSAAVKVLRSSDGELVSFANHDPDIFRDIAASCLALTPASPPPARIDEPDIGKLCAALVASRRYSNVHEAKMQEHADTIAEATAFMEKNNDNR